MKVLVVCAGNTCRSPMAGGLLRRLAETHQLNLEVRTAGLAHHPNASVAEKAVAVMKELDIDISHDYSKGVTEDLLIWADTVITVEQGHQAYLLEMFSSSAHKVRALDRDVRDPYLGSITDYREARDTLEQLLAQFILGNS